jgi:tRNA 2-thiouridine synthesizing protein A
MPVLRAARALRAMAAGEKLRVLATDPEAVVDFRDFCKISGHALVAASETRGVYSFTIRRGAET